MIFYRVKDWEKHFENSRSRQIENPRWVAIPNKHDGETYTRVITHEQGAAIFAAWVLILQVSSKCQARGTLVKSDGTPMTPESLSLKTRAPREWFELAFEFLSSSEIGWIETFTKDTETERQPDDTRVTLACHPPVRSWTQKGIELEGIEQKELKGGVQVSPRGQSVDNDAQMRTNAPTPAPDANIPTLEEVKAFGRKAVPEPIPDDCCERFWHWNDINHGWIKNGRLINWQKLLVQWWNRDKADPKHRKNGDADYAAWGTAK